MRRENLTNNKSCCFVGKQAGVSVRLSFCSSRRPDHSCSQLRRRRGGSEPEESDPKLSAFRLNQLFPPGVYGPGVQLHRTPQTFVSLELVRVRAEPEVCSSDGSKRSGRVRETESSRFIRTNFQQVLIRGEKPGPPRAEAQGNRLVHALKTAEPGPEHVGPGSDKN